MTFFETVLAGVISTFVGGVCLLLLERSLSDGFLKRSLLVVEGIYYYGCVGWLIARCFFSDHFYYERPTIVDLESVKTFLGDTFYNELTPAGHFILFAGVVAGAVMGIWYPDKVLAFRNSARRKST